MGRLPTNPSVTDFIKKNVRDTRGDLRSGTKLLIELQKWAKEKGISKRKLPSVRQIDRIRKPVVDKLRKEEAPFRDRLDTFRWPNSMGTEALPWSSTPAVFEFLRLLSPVPLTARPTVAEVAEFWHLRLAAPDAPLELLGLIYLDLLGRESDPGAGRIQETVFESFLVHQPWARGNFAQFVRSLERPMWAIENMTEAEKLLKKKLIDELETAVRKATKTHEVPEEEKTHS